MPEENWGVRLVEPVVDMSVRGLCVAPYPDHKKGCPNFNRKEGCPPKAPRIHELIDLSQPVYAVWNRFDFGAHVERMREKHPGWSERQLRCCLYWQPSARKQLKRLLMRVMRNPDGIEQKDRVVLVACPEGAGIDVTKTMADIGIELEWPTRKYAYQIVLLGYGNKEQP